MKTGIVVLSCLALVWSGATLADQEVKVATKGGLKVESGDGQFKFAAGGRIQADLALYQSDQAKLHSGTEFRRLRFFLKGRMFGDWEYKFQPDISEDELTIQDAYLRYAGMQNAGVTIGSFRQPFSLEDMNSSKYITFMERGLPNVFAPGIRMGLGYDRHWDNASFAAAIMGQPAGKGDDGDEGLSVGSRLTFAPRHEKGQVLHFGASVAWQQPEDSINQDLRYRQRPESHVTNTRLVDTGTIVNVDNTLLYGLEAAGVWGPLSAQTEYMVANVSALEDYTFGGGYAYVSYFLTGESRPYNVKDGTFGRIKPKGKGGAWEVALRYSTLDLSDGTVLGGKENNITVGLNYQPNPNVRFMANYIMVDTDEDAGDDDPSILQMRAQIDF